MALYGEARDISLFRHFNRELMGNIISQQCVYYKYDIEETKVNIYGEPKPIEPEPVVETSSISREMIEGEKQRIQNEIDKIIRSGASGRKAGPAIEQLQSQLRDLDNIITY